MENKYHYSGFNPKISYEDIDGKYQESFTMMKNMECKYLKDYYE